MSTFLQYPPDISSGGGGGGGIVSINGDTTTDQLIQGDGVNITATTASGTTTIALESNITVAQISANSSQELDIGIDPSTAYITVGNGSNIYEVDIGAGAPGVFIQLGLDATSSVNIPGEITYKNSPIEQTLIPFGPSGGVLTNNIGTPAGPNIPHAGYTLLYIKNSDGKLYRMGSNGVEVLIG